MYAFQDTKLNIVDFDPALLPIQPSDETVNVSYGIRSFDVDSYDADLLVSVVLDTPYNVRDVSHSRAVGLVYQYARPGSSTVAIATLTCTHILSLSLSLSLAPPPPPPIAGCGIQS